MEDCMETATLNERAATEEEARILRVFVTLAGRSKVRLNPGKGVRFVASTRTFPKERIEAKVGVILDWKNCTLWPLVASKKGQKTVPVAISLTAQSEVGDRVFLFRLTLDCKVVSFLEL